MIELRDAPIVRLDAASQGGSTLWIKNDAASTSIYGGNKPRKLAPILDDARRTGATRLVTFGAAGSHHVLATTLFGRAAGFRVAAILTPQARTEHAAEVLRAAIGAGVEPIPVSNVVEAIATLAAIRREGDYVIPPGGANALGALAYANAVRDVILPAIRANEIPVPNVIVVPLGSGGTAVGLAAGVARAKLRTIVHAVSVYRPVLASRVSAVTLALRATWPSWRWARGTLARLWIDARWVGDGYGVATAAGRKAAEIARGYGIGTDATYTAKAFAAALDDVGTGKFANVLYWHTLSGVAMERLLRDAPGEGEMGEVRRLLI